MSRLTVKSLAAVHARANTNAGQLFNSGVLACLKISLSKKMDYSKI